jgi:hypothetical protein
MIEYVNSLKSSIFWDITSYFLLKFNLQFRGTCRFHLQGGSNLARNQRGAGSEQSFDPEGGGDMFPENVG